MKTKIFKKLKFISKFLILVIIPIIGILCSTTASAKAEYYSGLTDEELAEIFELKISDVVNPWQWISDTQTFVIVEKNGDNISYWWNAPNIQMSAFNSLYSIMSMSGYGAGIGVPAKNSSTFLSLPNSENAHTALQKYGFNIPNPAYMGERPLVTISILGVLLPEDTANWFTRLFGFAFSGTIVSLPTDQDLNTLMYLAPRDYETGGITFQHWVDLHWKEAMENIEDGQVLLSSADENGEYSGAQWVKDTIINQNGLENSTDAAYICQQLSEICGMYYSDVAKNIIICSNVTTTNGSKRVMPYDLSRMNSIDAAKFNGIVDPRSNMQENLLSTGYANLISNMFKGLCLTFSSTLSELSVSLNQLCSFPFLEHIVGLNPTILWTNSLFTFLTLILILFFLFFSVKSIVEVFKGSKSALIMITKIMGTFIVCAIIITVGLNPQSTYDFIKNTSSAIWSVGNVTLESNESLSNLYGNGGTKEKEDCSLWLPYFNVWTTYQTNHSLLDQAQLVDTSSEEPEEKNLTTPIIGDKDQNLWSTILADAFTKSGNYSNDIYRVVDHFMAPRVSNLVLNESSKNASFDVNRNENYNGDIQSSINWGVIPFQILILILIFVKVILFYEFILNIMMLFINVTLSITNRHSLAKILKELGASCLNIVFIGLIITLVIHTSLIVSDLFAVIICGFYVFILIGAIKQLLNSNSVFKPKALRSAQKAGKKVKAMFSDGGC